MNLADLSEAHLVKADLSEAHLVKADLSRADLGRANLSGAYLNLANLSGAYLWAANLSGAYLREANLSRASLVEANLSGAGLWGVRCWAVGQLAGAREGALMPDGIRLGRQGTSQGERTEGLTFRQWKEQYLLKHGGNATELRDTNEAVQTEP